MHIVPAPHGCVASGSSFAVSCDSCLAVWVWEKECGVQLFLKKVHRGWGGEALYSFSPLWPLKFQNEDEKMRTLRLESQLLRTREKRVKMSQIICCGITFCWTQNRWKVIGVCVMKLYSGARKADLRDTCCQFIVCKWSLWRFGSQSIGT